MLPPADIPADTAGSILLVEEYAALAAAFSALLRNALPGCVVRTARSIAEAEVVAGEAVPALLIVDIDPPQRETVALLRRLKSSTPGVRIIVITAEDPQEVLREPNGPTAVHFIRKPFGLDEFTALVRAVMTAADSNDPARELKLVDLAICEALNHSTTFLQIDGPDGGTGELHFHDGRIIHAAHGEHRGRAALRELFRWRVARVRELEAERDAPRTIRGSWQPVLIEALRASREAGEATPRPKPAARAKAKAVTAGKKILVIDDTELLLDFVEEVLKGADPELRITRAETGITGAEAAASQRPDLILLDYSLPDITGGEVCERLLANEKTARIPIIMMSGHVQEMQSVAERFENVIAAIAKPFLSPALVDLVQKTLADLPGALQRRKQRIAKRTLPPASFSDLPKSHGANGGITHQPAAVEALKPVVAKGSLVLAPELVIEPIAEPLPEPVAELSPAAAAPEAPAMTVEPSLPEPSPAPTTTGEAAAESAGKNPVVLTLALEVLSIQFTRMLQMRAIRARPISPIVSLRLQPGGLASGLPNESLFELTRVNLDACGRIGTIRVAPTTLAMPMTPSHAAQPVTGLSVLPAQNESTVEMIPAPSSPLRMQLTALFELVGVELSATFGIGHLVLRWTGGSMLVTQLGGTAGAGVHFESAQVLLDRSAQIAEILLDAIA